MLFAVLRERGVRWEHGQVPPREFASAVDTAEQRLGGRAPATEYHRLVIDAERKFPDAWSADWRSAGRAPKWFIDGVDDPVRECCDRLARRARARKILAGRPVVLDSLSRVEQLIEWLRTQIKRLVAALRPTAAPSATPSTPAASPTTSPENSPSRPAEHRPASQPVELGLLATLERALTSLSDGNRSRAEAADRRPDAATLRADRAREADGVPAPSADHDHGPRGGGAKGGGERADRRQQGRKKAERKPSLRRDAIAGREERRAAGDVAVDPPPRCPAPVVPSQGAGGDGSRSR